MLHNIRYTFSNALFRS